MIIDSEKHFFITSSGKIDTIIEPIKDYFGFNYFEYVKNFNDGSEIRLSNQPTWLAYYYEHELYKHNLFERYPTEFIKAHVVWTGLSIYEPVLKELRKFNIDHGITFIEPDVDGCEFFFMGTGVGNAHLIPRYLSQMDLLERFIRYFREKAKSVIAEACHHKVTITDKFSLAPKLFCLKELSRATFVNSVSAIEFTERELACLQLLAKGYTQKMIAAELGISPRTVETYLNQVKQKTNTDSKKSLLQYFEKMA